MGVWGGEGEESGRRGGAVDASAKELAEEEASGGEDASVGVEQPAFNVEGDVAEGLAVDEQVEVVQGEGLEAVLHVHLDVKESMEKKVEAVYVFGRERWKRRRGLDSMDVM